MVGGFRVSRICIYSVYIYVFIIVPESVAILAQAICAVHGDYYFLPTHPHLICTVFVLHLGPRQLFVRLLSVNLDAELISSDIRQSQKETCIHD